MKTNAVLFRGWDRPFEGFSAHVCVCVCESVALCLRNFSFRSLFPHAGDPSLEERADSFRLF